MELPIECLEFEKRLYSKVLSQGCEACDCHCLFQDKVEWEILPFVFKKKRSLIDDQRAYSLHAL
jgi:hypothetical protein